MNKNKENTDPTIRIKDQPLRGSSLVAVIAPAEYNSLRHSKRYQGGDWELSFFLPAATVPMEILREWFDTLLMYRVEEIADGEPSWKGVIWEMDLVYRGIKRRRSAGKIWNAVKCVYTLNTDTSQNQTGYFTDTSSISQYLRREFIVYQDNVTLAQAEAAATDFLTRNLEPRSELIGVGVRGEGLYITAVGDVATLNNLYATVTTNGTAQAGDFVSTIIGTDSNIVGPGRIYGNTLTIEKEQRQPTRVWDLLLRIALVGDGVAPYRIYVKEGLLHYHPVNTDYEYEWNDIITGLQKKKGGSVTWSAEPGIMRDFTIPGGAPPLGSFLSDRRDSVLDEVQMWQGAQYISVVTDDMEEDDLIQAASNYQQMMTDYSLDPLHTPTRDDN